MLSPELLKKIKAIHIRTDHLVNDVLAGEYVSAFKGRGIEFEEVREYVGGDDIRMIDWNVTARTGTPYVKQFREERELTILLMVDVSQSGRFGTHLQLKNEVAAEIAAVLAFSAIKNNDKVGLVIFSDQVEKYIPPKKGKSHVFRVIKEVLAHNPHKRNTDLGNALEFLNNVMRRKAVVFLISDFLAGNYQTPLKFSAKRHDMIAVQIRDPREISLPPVGILELEDAETGETTLVDTFDLNVMDQYTKMNRKECEQRANFFQSIKVDLIDVVTERSFIDPIIRFFRMRENRK